MNKQKLIEYCEYLKGDLNKFINGIDVNKIIKMIEQLDEPQKVTIPQYVADWIEVCKEHLTSSLYLAMTASFLKANNQSFELILWIKKKENQDAFALAWINGYEVKKEKRYEVILSNGQSLKTVYRQGDDRLDFEKVYGDLERFTRKQLEDAGLAWVFDCPGVKVKEVEE